MNLAYLGPGILLAATSIGASHILMSPEAGARYGFGLTWLILVTHLVKYQAFACAPRYVAATGTSLLDAYAQAPGPRHWAIWLGLLDMSVQAIGLVAALVGLTATFLVTAVGGLGLVAWSLVLVASLLALLAGGRYGALRAVNLVLVLALSVGTLIAFFAAPPPASALVEAVTPSLPAGSLLLAAGILGFMPTSVAVSIWQSLWALEHGRFATPADGRERRLRLRQGLFDLRLGYALSALLAVLFVSLGATLLFPRGDVPEGPQVALTLSRLFTLVLGPWMRPVFLGMAFCALFTTCYTMMDGFPRAFVAARRVLRGLPASQPGRAAARGTVYWVFLLTVTFGGMVILKTVPDPAFLVKAVGALGLLGSPVYFALNLWAVRCRIDDPALRPGPLLVAGSLAGIAFMIFTAGLLIWTTFFTGPSGVAS